MGKKYSYEEMIDILEERGYKYIEGEFKNVFSKLTLINKDGYKVYSSMDAICNSGNNPNAFHKSNPYTIENINLYLLNNDYPCSIQANQEYINASKPLKFVCSCGNEFSTNWTTIRARRKIKCDDCTGYSGHLTYENVVNKFNEYGLTLLCSKEEYKGVTLSPLICMDNDGYKYVAVFNQLKVNNGKFEKFHPNNPFTIENINNYFHIYANDKYKCVSETYNGSRTKLKFQHVECGRYFENTLSNIVRCRTLNSITDNKTGARCPHCDANQLESLHALILKQVWLHEHPDTIPEDKSCINPLTNCPLPTDIVNHRLKTAIEIQSWFHDKESQKIKDDIKKNYWLNRGYKFYAIDHREYSVLEMIQLFFPNIEKIPDYIDFKYANKTDYTEVQDLLSQGFSIPYVSEKTNISRHKIYDAIYAGKVIVSSNRKNACFQPVVQLSRDYSYINEFESIAEAGRKTGLKYANIVSALNYGRHYSQGFLWYRKEDYEKEILCKTVTGSPETAGYVR